jgi:MoxR-like ATPase
VDIGRATRADDRVDVGVSPRGIQKLFESARARAVLNDRTFVTPDDVKQVVEPVLAHRIVLKPEAAIEGIDKVSIVREAIDEIPVPTVELDA